MSEKTEKLLEKSIKNLRDNLSKDISMDTFVKSTIETLMTDEISLSLYKKGMTSNDIEEFMREVFEEKMSPTKISNLAKTFNKFRTAWESSKLDKRYKAVFGDVVFITQ